MSKLLDIKPKILCDHEIRKCLKCDLYECTKCFSLLTVEEIE